MSVDVGKPFLDLGQADANGNVAGLNQLMISQPPLIIRSPMTI